MPSEPNINWLLEMIGRGASAAADYITPDYYSRGSDGYLGRYSPEEWKDWHEKSGTFGTKEFAGHSGYLQLADPRLKRRLYEYGQHLLDQPQQDEQGNPTPAATALQAIGSPVGREMRRQILGFRSSDDPAIAGRASQEVEAFFDWLKGTSLFGDERPDTSVTPEQMREWKNDPEAAKRWQSDWRLTPAGREAHSKSLDYHLLNAFQQGKHQPAALNMPVMSGIGGMLGNAFEAVAHGPDYGAPGTKVGEAQTAMLANPNPASAMRYAMEVARFAETQDPEYYNSWFMGSASPDMSLMTGEGLARKSSAGDTPYGRATRYQTAPLLMPNWSQQERGALVDFMNAQDRGTPIRPAGDYEKAEDLRRAAHQLENDNWKQISAYMPKWIRDFNSTFAASPAAWGGELPPPPAGQKYEVGPAGYPQLVEMSKGEKEYQDWRNEQGAGGQRPSEPDKDPWAKVGITPFHSTAAFNDMGMVAPAVLGDPGNLATTLVMGPLAWAATGSKVQALKAMLAGNIGDLPSEFGYNTALSLTMTPQSMYGYFTEGDPNNPVRNPDGSIPAADTMQYMDRLADWEKGRQGTVDNIIDYQKRLRGQQAAPNNGPRKPSVLEAKPF